MARKYEKLSPSEVSRMFNGMSPQKATNYYRAVMTNPDSPKENIDLVRQYRQQNPQKFLSDEEMMSRRRSGVWMVEGNYGRGFGRRNRTYDSDGFSYDQYGNRYDAYGNMTGGYNDGGSEAFRGNGNPNGFSDYYGAANQRPRRGFRRPISEERSYDELGQTLMSFGSDVARTRYFMKVANNPETNPETLNNLVRFRNNNPQIFASDEEAKANGPTMKPRQGFWSQFWKSEDDFSAMEPKKQKFFVRAFQGRNRARNTAYGLRVMTNPVTSAEDKKAMAEVVNENPGLFFKSTSEYNYQGRN